MFEALKATLTGTLSRLSEKTLAFLPNFLAMLIILAIGLMMAMILRWVVRRGLKAIKCDEWCDKTGFAHLLLRAGIRSSPSVLLAHTVFWLVVLVFLVAGLSSLEMAVVNHLLAALVGYLPRVFAALLILVVGFLLANFLARAVLLAAVNANMASPHWLSSGVKFLVAALTVAMALEQLSIAAHIVMAAFTIVFGGVTLALAIAFGLAGRDVAKEFLRQQFAPQSEEGRDEISHI